MTEMDEPQKRPVRLKRYTNFAVAMDMLVQRRISLVNPSMWTDKNDTYLIERYRRENNLAFIGAVCMTEALETFHHWKIFADGMNGICVEFHKDKLENCLKLCGGIEYGNVRYLKLDEVTSLPKTSLPRLPFAKRAGYKDEREYRIIHGSTEPKEFFPVPFTPDCINRIILSPFLPAGLAETMKSTIKKIEACSDKRVVRSHLINSTSWQRKWDKSLGIGQE